MRRAFRRTTSSTELNGATGYQGRQPLARTETLIDVEVGRIRCPSPRNRSWLSESSLFFLQYWASNFENEDDDEDDQAGYQGSLAMRGLVLQTG